MQSENQKEAMNMTGCIQDPNQTVKIGAWNVRTFYLMTKLAQALKEMKRNH
jgi:hypothetical protein